MIKPIIFKKYKMSSHGLKSLSRLEIRANYRELLAETYKWIILAIFTVGSSPFLSTRYGFLVNLLEVEVSIAIFCFIGIKYIILRSTRWYIDGEIIQRKQGIFNKQIDYIELYRVVDYSESQSLSQKIFGVKTVSIISTDKSDMILHIHGIPAKSNLIGYIRSKVEQCKTEKRIYEVTNN